VAGSLSFFWCPAFPAACLALPALLAARAGAFGGPERRNCLGDRFEIIETCFAFAYFDESLSASRPNRPRVTSNLRPKQGLPNGLLLGFRHKPDGLLVWFEVQCESLPRAPGRLVASSRATGTRAQVREYAARREVGTAGTDVARDDASDSLVASDSVDVFAIHDAKMRDLASLWKNWNRTLHSHTREHMMSEPRV
jgi:hypothetical protein